MSSEFNNWCPEIYRGVFVDRWNDDQIVVAPCCQAQGKIVDIDQFDYVTNDYLTDLRQQFAQGHKPSACDWCWKDESLGKKSRRLSAIEFYNIEPSDDVVLESMDHSSTWACNLACVMCGPDASSTWATELNLDKQQLKSIGRNLQKKNTILDNIDLGNLKRIHFNGGEPMLNLEQLNLLRRVDLSNVVISYNTNGTIYPTPQLIDVWAQAKLVKLFFSIDAVGTAFEYIRWPASWDQVSNNMLSMKANLPSNVMFSFNVAVGSHNALEIHKVWQWFSQHMATNREGDASDFCYQFVKKFDIRSLTSIAKQCTIDTLKDIVELQGIVAHCEQPPSGLGHNYWISELDKIDSRRNTNWRTALEIGKFY